MLETLVSCPYCNSDKIQPFLQVKDYTVSRETFSIQECSACGLLFTNPRPSPDSIGAYYKSEEYISHTNAKKGLVNSLYQNARKFALNRKLALVKTYCSSGSLLDIGCGTGEFLAHCKTNGFDCLGVEPDESARRQAETNYGLNIFEPEYLLSLKTGTFDVITMWHVLEHVYDPRKTINQLFNVLNSDGYCIIAVPNPDSYDAAIYKEKWAAFDVPRHLFHYKPAFLKSAFAEAGFQLMKTYPMSLDAFYVSLLSEKYQAGGVGIEVLFKAFSNGLRSNMKAGSPEKYSSVIYVFKKTA